MAINRWVNQAEQGRGEERRERRADQSRTVHGGFT